MMIQFASFKKSCAFLLRLIKIRSPSSLFILEKPGYDDASYATLHLVEQVFFFILCIGDIMTRGFYKR